jgi:hypothetical protein
MCVIIYYRKNNNNILIKNRDRNYIPKIEIIQEIVNGVEVAYIHDLYTSWIEGLNEYGFAILNSALQVTYDENPSENIKSRTKYLNALSNYSINQFQNSIINPSYYYDISLQGHTLFANPYFCIHMESYTNLKPVISLLDKSSVYTNHGVNIKNIGYVTKEGRKSSILRKKLIEMELNRNNNIINNYSDLINLLNINYTKLEPKFHPYRNNSKTFTTSQMLMDLNNKILIFNYDKDYCNYIGIVNRLPSDYKSKIKIKVNKTTKNILKSNIN